MAEVKFNGLVIVPLNSNDSILSMISSTAASDQHPFRGLYLMRHSPPEHSTWVSHPAFVPKEYNSDDMLIGPDPFTNCSCTGISQLCRENNVSEQQTVRLCDVEEFRNRTAKKVLQHDVNNNSVAGLNAIDSHLSTSSSSFRPVIYRYVGAIKGSLAVLEAIHFELFMPDRSDLRFLAIQVESIPPITVEGDYFYISEADLLSDPSFSIKLGEVEYPVIWEIKHVRKISSHGEQEGLAYIFKEGVDFKIEESVLTSLLCEQKEEIWWWNEPRKKKKFPCSGMIAVSDVVTEDLFIPNKLFPDENKRKAHSVVGVTFKIMWSTANLFPVEAVRIPHLDDEKKSKILNSLSCEELDNVYKLYSRKSNRMNYNDTLEYLDCQTGDQLMKILFKLGHSDVDPVSEYLKRISGVRSSTQHMRGVATDLRLLSMTEDYWIKDRLGSFTNYGRTEDDLKLMDQYFKLGSRFRNRAALEENDGDSEINESLVLKTLKDPSMEERLSLKNCRRLLDCIYGWKDTVVSRRPAVMDNFETETIEYKDGTILQLNPAQSRAVQLYADKDGPRVFCVSSPPGSGKTMTAIAMAAKISRPRRGIQLLLSVQNVAVDNLGHLLKKVDYGEVEVYNMKTKRLNPHEITPFDLFDSMNEDELEKWRNEEAHVPNYDARNRHEKNKFTERQKELEKRIIKRRQAFENDASPEIILATVEMAIHKKMNNSKLEERLSRVRGIIIDEASLLTEASLFAIIRRFPQARIVLIGDEQQLPPYQYDETILGQELAGRSALSVAMKNANMTLVEMNEIYKAPPSLIAPYNRLAYNNKLISRKAEDEGLLCKMGLVLPGYPQLLLIDVDGKEERVVKNGKTISISNPIELEAVVCLLKYLPREWAKDIMIICLYKGQMLKLDQMLNGGQKSKQYNVLTVDSAQGKEAPIVILLTTRLDDTVFFCNKNRCNVAVSRHQKAFIILGDSDLLISTYPWTTVLNHGDFPQVKYLRNIVKKN